MPTCSLCGEKIEFKPHPISGKITPFSGDEIHFAICKKKKDDRFTAHVDPRLIKCHCGAGAESIYWGQITGAVRLRLAFTCEHKGIFLAETDENKAMINCTEREYLENKVNSLKDPWGHFAARLRHLPQSSNRSSAASILAE